MAKKEVKRLYRSEDDRMIGGVCGGFAEYFQVDPVLVRAIFVVLLLTASFGFWAYIILWIIMPLKSQVVKAKKVSKKKK